MINNNFYIFEYFNVIKRGVIGDNMIFMIIFWGLYVLALILYLYKVIKKVEKLSNLITFIVFIAFAFLIIGLITKDPIFSAIGISKEYEYFLFS